MDTSPTDVKPRGGTVFPKINLLIIIFSELLVFSFNY